MRENLTEIVCVLDRSGSMDRIIDEAIGGLNTFINDQKKLDGDANITIALFGNLYEVVYDNVDIKSIPEITRDIYNPRGMTALYDAIGKTMTSVGERLAQTSEEDRPEKVMVVILTDGQENNSVEYSAINIADMIKHQEEKYGWAFVYLASNVDAVATGSVFGMKANNTLSFSSTTVGTKSAFDNMSLYSTNVRGMAKGVSIDTLYSTCKAEATEL